MTWLSSLPGWLLVCGSLLVFGFTAFVLRRVAERAASSNDPSNHHTVAGGLMPGLCAIFGIIASLTMLHQLDEWTRAQATVNAEATAAARLASSVIGQQASSVQGPLVTFLTAERKYEWDRGVGQPAPPAVVAAMRQIESNSRRIALAPQTKSQSGSEILSALDALATARRDRLDSQSSHLPTLFVIALILAGFAVIANGAVMTASRPKTGRLIILLTAVVAVDVALVIMLWTPFGGSLQISDQPVLQVISELRSGLFN